MILVIFFFFNIAHADAIKNNDIYQKLKDLNTMREALAESIRPTEKINEETFKKTCQPVGMELKRWAEENGFLAKQISHKNRNQHNAIPPNLASLYQTFLNQAELNQLKKSITFNELKGEGYFYRISIKQSCLNCHGSQISRPEFIKEKYKSDKAFDFKEGDLRGVYFVFKKENK